MWELLKMYKFLCSCINKQWTRFPAYIYTFCDNYAKIIWWQNYDWAGNNPDTVKHTGVE